jgi:hypothetical protein
MRQTAVDWLVSILNKEGFAPVLTNEEIKQAKEMEKGQIIDAGNTCALKQTIHNRKVDLMSLEELEQFALEDAINVGEEYYNETFKNK